MAKVKFGNVVKEYKGKIDQKNNPYEFYVAGDHMDTDDLTIRRRGRFATDDVGPAFIREFKKGQVLYGSRRTYLRKIAVADFDGVTANTTFVLETKDESILRQRLLPFIMYTESFTEWSIKKSKGSTNPYVLFKDLADYEFELPDIGKQDELVELLWSMIDTRDAYNNLIVSIDELVKSQFIERFEGQGYAVVKAKTFMTNMRNGISPSKKGLHAEKVLTLSAVTQGAFDPEAWKDGIFDECPPADKRIHTSEFYMCRGNGNKMLVGTAVFSPEDHDDLVFPDTVIAAHIDSNIILLPYLFVAWKMPSVRKQIEVNARTTNGTYKINQTVLSNIELIVPPLEKQNEFVSFVEQSDKSKFELRKALAELTAMYKRIIQENLV